MTTRRLIRLPLLCLILLASPLARGENLQTLVELTGTLAEKYGVALEIRGAAFEVKTAHAKITGQAAPVKELGSYLVLLKQEFCLYPPELVRRAKLKRIILCTRLAYGGQFRGAIPDFEHDDLYFDVNFGRYDELYTRKCIHHEFFHVVDWQDDYEVYSDAKWAALNAKDFRYGKGGAAAQDDNEMSLITDKYPGFLTKYSTTGVEEDKAEVFAHLVVCGKLVDQRSARDEVLRNKARTMIALIEKFSPKTDQKFWQAMQKIERPTDKLWAAPPNPPK